MSTPSSRIINQLGLHGSSQGDAQMVEQLQLYKTPAIIRDMKQVFFYVQINANSTIQSPLSIYTNSGRKYYEVTPFVEPIVSLNNVPPYYTPLGTKRRFLLWEQLNSLLDVRVPKDKYYLELKLSEAQIESDPTNWNKIRNQIAYQPEITGTLPTGVPKGGWVIAPSYNPSYTFGTTPVIDGGLQNVQFQYFQEATKISRPQPLFVRIPQLNNGEPYNWTVVNNGGNNDDKEHQTVVLHGDIKSQELEIEFGHLMYKGKDTEYQQFGKSKIDPQDGGDQKIWNDSVEGGVTNPINNYQSFEYLDYNWDWNNSEPKALDSAGASAFFTNNGNKYVAPSARNGSIVAVNGGFSDGGTSNKLYIANPPVKSNQQVSSILFRFQVNLIHLF